MDSMPQVALIHFGNLPILGRVPLPSELKVERNQWVVCQTGRGLEMGLVKDLTVHRNYAVQTSEATLPDPTFVRMATEADHLAHQRLESKKAAGLNACANRLADTLPGTVLLDVDVTLDGQRIYFHFLGDTRDLDNQVDSELAEIYDQATGIRSFTSAVATGCGPECGRRGDFACQQKGSSRF